MQKRPFKLHRFQRDAVCQSAHCVKGDGTIKAGSFAFYAAGAIYWHDGCAVPAKMDEPYTPDPNGLDRWIDRKIEENETRLAAVRASLPQATGGTAGAVRPERPIPGTAAEVTHAPATTPATVTSDPRYEDAF